VNTIWYYIRDRSFRQAEKLLEEEKVSKEDAKKLIQHLRDKYCRPVDLIEIKKSDVDVSKVMNKENQYSLELPQYLVSSGGLMNQSPLCQDPYTEGGFGFYVGTQIVSLKKIDQIWKMIPKLKKGKNDTK
jgi:hypothetical protein